MVREDTNHERHRRCEARSNLTMVASPLGMPRSSQ